MREKESKISKKPAHPDISTIINIVAKGMNKEAHDEDHAILGRFYVEQAPKKLYKYRSYQQERDINTILGNKMWFPSMPTLNDPFEASSIISASSVLEYVLEQNIEIRETVNGLPTIERQQFFNDISGKIETDVAAIIEIGKDFSVACLCEKNDSILMWGHYANGHQGICVEYNLLDLASKANKVFIPVNYSDTIPILGGFDSISINRFLLQLISTKAKDWSYECEWRCIQDKGACGDRWTTEGALLDVVPPTAVYLGCKASNTTIDSLMGICEKTIKIPLYIMERSKTQYKLTQKRIL